jgi:hypothetical protein
MSSRSLVWAGVPHNGDGVVFQVRVDHGLQRFHIARFVLEDVFDLEPSASDAQQFDLFYASLKRILDQAAIKRSIASPSTVSLLTADFDRPKKKRSKSAALVMAYGAL